MLNLTLDESQAEPLVSKLEQSGQETLDDTKETTWEATEVLDSIPVGSLSKSVLKLASLCSKPSCEEEPNSLSLSAFINPCLVTVEMLQDKRFLSQSFEIFT